MRTTIILILLLALLNVSTLAQAPQGTNYQAVAYNNLSQPVVNQSVGVRLSVLDGGVNGPVLYQETQQPSTDNTGLFSIVLGNGTLVSGSFPAINWSAGTKWLKSEIDITGGNNYVVMGSSQFMSVPYALYANEAGFAKKAGPATATFQLPDGFEDPVSILLRADSNYTVPEGKNLYLSSSTYGISIDGKLISFGANVDASDPRTMAAASEGSVVSCKGVKGAFLVRKTVDWITINHLANAYIVPPGKQLVIMNQSGYLPPTLPYLNCQRTINAIPLDYQSNNLTNSVWDEGTVLSSVGCPAGSEGYFNINGYLRDK